MSSGIKKTLTAMATLALGVAVFFALKALKKPPPRKIERTLRVLKTIPLRLESVIPRVTAYATAVSSSDIQISAEVGGKITHCASTLNDGCEVRKGDVLITIERDDYQIRVDQSEAELSALKSEAKRTERDITDLKEMLEIVKQDFELEDKNYKRVKTLFDKNVTSQSDLDRARQSMTRRKKIMIEMGNTLAKAKFNLTILKNKTKEADARLRQAKLDLSRTVIKAPISGRIDKCAVDADEYVRAGDPVCAIKVDAKPEMSVSVNARDFANVLGIKPNPKTHWFNFPDTIKVTAAWVEAPRKCKWRMRIKRVQRYNPQTDTVSVLVAADKYIGTDETPYNIIPGMFCELRFSAPPMEAFRIPFSALQIGDNVYTIDKTGVLRRHHVTPFHVENDDVVIRSGLPDGENVVAQQLPRGLVDGMKVKAAVEDADEK